MHVDELRNDREPEAAAALVARPRVVETHESVEHARAVLGRNARAVVVDGERDEAVALLDRERDRAGSMASGVVGDVAQDAGQRARITRDSAGGHRVGIDRQCRRVAQTARFGEHEIVEVDGAGRQAQHVLVGPGQEQQIVDEMLDPQVIGEHVLGELARRHAPGMCAARPRRTAVSTRPVSAVRGRRPR